MVGAQGEEVVEEEVEAAQQKDSQDFPTTGARTDQEQTAEAEAAEEAEGEEEEVEGAAAETE